VAKGSKEAAWFLYQALSGIYPVFINNAELANRYLHQAAQLGHAQAQAELGLKYLEGQQIAQDIALGLSYLQKAAAQQNGVALNALGEAYEQGQGVESNIEQAVQYYQQAAAQVNADAYSHLGRLYIKGIGVERDIGIAQDWLEKGSLLGHERSTELLK
ncbi:sel1 repeat family protein, partial [Klebsiella pneumoniae]|nr:sel1 repeat family protein [Klebsiella pneumoniae]